MSSNFSRRQALVLGGAAAVIAYLLLAPQLGYSVPPSDLVVVALPSTLGFLYWLASGASFLPSLLWPLLLLAWMSLFVWVVPRPYGLIGVLIGVAVAAVMSMSPAAISFWVRLVARLADRSSESSKQGRDAPDPPPD